MTCRGLAFGHAALGMDVAALLPVPLGALLAAPANIDYKVRDVDNFDTAPADLIGIHKPDFVLIVPAVGSFSRVAAAPGQPAPRLERRRELDRRGAVRGRVESTSELGCHRDDGVGRLKFDFHTGIHPAPETRTVWSPGKAQPLLKWLDISG